MTCPTNQTLVNNTCIPTTCIVIINSLPTECADRGACTNGSCVCKTPKLDKTTKCEFCIGDVNLMPNISPDFPNCQYCLENHYKATDATGKQICVLSKCIGAYDTVCNGNGTCGKNGCECNSGVTYNNEQCLFCSENEQNLGGICISKSCIKDGVICSNNGKCDKTSSCKCDKGMAGKHCQECAEGYEMAISSGRCALKGCIFDGEICGGKTCEDDGTCSCHSGASGKYCQCGVGYRQAAEGNLRCFKDLCLSKKGQCYGRGTCIEKDSEFVCSDCGNFTFNDPKKGCQGCLHGSVKIPDSNYKCVSSKCMQEGADRPCNQRGECVIFEGSAKCKCKPTYTGEFCELCAEDENLSSLTCRSCKSGYQKQNGKCQPIACYNDGVECSGRGKCQDGKCVCQNDLLSDKCQDCKDSWKDINTNCTTCLNNFTLIDGTCYNSNCPSGYEFSVESRICRKIDEQVVPGVVINEDEAKIIDKVPAEKQKSNVMLISGISIAIILVIAAVVGLVVFVVYKKNRQLRKSESISQNNCEIDQQQFVINHEQVLYKK